MPDPWLVQARAELDALDDALLALLAERARRVAEIAAWKTANGLVFHDPAREAETVTRLRTLGVSRGLPPDGVETVVRAWLGLRAEVGGA